MMTEDPHEHARCQYVLELRERGATFAQIAAQMSMSVPRARKLVALAEQLDGGIDDSPPPFNKLAAMLTRRR